MVRDHGRRAPRRLRARLLGAAFSVLLGVGPLLTVLGAAPVAQATGAPATASLVPEVESNVAGLGVEITSTTAIGSFELTLTPSSASDVVLSSANCAATFHTCNTQADPTTGAVTIIASGGAGLAGPGELAFLAAHITAPVTSLAGVTLNFVTLADQHGAAVGLPAAVTADLQRGAVANTTTGWPASPRALGQGDVNAALGYLAGLEAAGLGSGQIDPVNMASAIPNGSSQANAPGPADAVGILQHLSGERGADFGLNVSATVSNVSTGGFDLQLTPAVPGLTVSNVSVPGALVRNVTESGAGSTYSVATALSSGTTYTATISAAGYDFSTLTVPVPGPTSVAVSVPSASVTGFTLDLSQPVPGLSIGLSGATVASVTHSPDYTTYTVAASLAPKGSYPLILSATGYTFTGPTSVDVGTQPVDVTVASQSVTGFTLDLSVPVPGLSIGLSNATVTSVTYSPGYRTYTVAASLAPNGSYPLALSAAGYSFTGAASVDLGAQTVSVTVANPSLTGFALDLSVPVPGLSVGLTNATVTSVTYSPDYTTYTVGASLAADQSYPLSLSATGYSFTGATSVDVGAQAVTATVANPTLRGFAIDFSEPVPGLTVNLTGATVSQVTYSSDYMTYSVAAPLAADTSYPLSLSAPGYTISGGNAVNVPVQTVTATVTNPSLSGFTLGFPEPVPGLTVDLTGATVSQVTHSPDYTTYAVDAPLAAGTDYPLSLSAPGYTISVSSVGVPVQQVTATVTDQTPTTFDLGLSMPVPNLTVAVTGATVSQATYSPDYMTYSVTTSQLVGGQSYPLVLTAPGYTFTAPSAVGVPAQTVAAAVYGATPDAFTLTMPSAPKGFGPSSLELTAGGSPVTSGTPVASGSGTYSVPVPGGLTFGTTYTLKLVQSGYTFAAPVTFGVNQPLASSNDGITIVLDFGTQMAAPRAAPAGFTVTVNGVADTVSAATYEAQNPSKIDLVLTNPIVFGSVAVSYTPGTLQLQGGVAWPAFSGVTLTTAGTVANSLLSQPGADATTVADGLAAAGYTPEVVAQVLAVDFSSETSTQVATVLLSEMNAPINATAIGLVLAGFQTNDAAATLKGVYGANAPTIATLLLAEEGNPPSASSVVAMLKATGFIDAPSLAQALYACNFTVQQAISALQPIFPTGLGPELTGAGYNLTDTVNAFLNLNALNDDTAALVSAFPTVFLTTSYALATAQSVAAYVYGQNIPVAQATSWLEAAYPTVGQSPSTLAEALTGSSTAPVYPIDDVTTALLGWFQAQNYPPGGPMAEAAASALKAAGWSVVDIAKAIQTVMGQNAVTLASYVLPTVGVASPVPILRALQQAGFGLGDVAAAALSLARSNVDIASPYLNEAGYSAAQVMAALGPTLKSENSFNVGAIATMLNSVDSSVSPPTGYYSPTDIAAILQSDVGASASAAGAQLLGSYISLADAASALKSVYGIDGLAFEQVAASYYTDPLAFAGQLTGSGGVIALLQSTFSMTDVQTAEALHSYASANSDNALDTVIADIDSAYGVPSGSLTLQMMEQAGYSLAEVAQVMLSENNENLSPVLTELYSAKYSIDAVAAYLDSYYNAGVTSLATTANNLMQAGYGSCTTNLTGIVSTLELTYKPTDTELETGLTATPPGCTLTEVTAAIQAVSPSSQLAATALQLLSTSGQPVSDAIELLEQVFGYNSSTMSAASLASTLLPAGFTEPYILPALRQLWGVSSASSALTLLNSTFGVATGPQAVTDLLNAGYDASAVILALGSTDPLTLNADLQGTTVPAVDTLIQMFGPGGAINQPLAMAKDLNQLGLSEADAVPILESYGYTTPAEVGSLLFTDGYPLGYVAQGIYDTLPGSAITSGWTNALMQVLVEMTGCSATGLGALPACASGTSTFTLGDAMQAFEQALGATSASCSDAEFCALLWQAMSSSGYSVSTIMSTLLAAPFDMPMSQLGYNLQTLAGYSASQIVNAEQAAPVNATVDQIAASLYATTSTSVQAGDALTTITDLQTASEAMMAAGYNAQQIGDLYASLGATFQEIYQDLRAIGFDYSDAFAAAYNLYPETPQQVMDFVGSNEAG